MKDPKLFKQKEQFSVLKPLKSIFIYQSLLALFLFSCLANVMYAQTMNTTVNLPSTCGSQDGSIVVRFPISTFNPVHCQIDSITGYTHTSDFQTGFVSGTAPQMTLNSFSEYEYTFTSLKAGIYRISVEEFSGTASDVRIIYLRDAPASYPLFQVNVYPECAGFAHNGSMWRGQGVVEIVNPDDTSTVQGYKYGSPNTTWHNSDSKIRYSNFGGLSMSVYIQEPNGCRSFMAAHIPEDLNNVAPTALSPSVSGSPNCQASLVQNVIGGTPPYTYRALGISPNGFRGDIESLTNPISNYCDYMDFHWVRDANGCSISLDTSLVVALSIDKKENSHGIKIVNNIEGKKLILSATNHGDLDELSFKLINLQGQIIREIPYPKIHNDNIEISTANLPAGWYILTAESENIHFSEKFLVTE